MEQIYSENGIPLNMEQVFFLNNSGTEYLVYKYLKLALKLYRNDLKCIHLRLEELNYLKGIETKRILLPNGILKDKNGELIGYQMPFISGSLNLRFFGVEDFFKELEILDSDINILSEREVILNDITANNTIFNGGLYLVDPGDYIIGDLGKVLDYALNISEEEKIMLIKKWNYHKINSLTYDLLFMKNDGDYFKNSIEYGKIIKFFNDVKKREKIIYNLEVFKMYLRSDMNVGDSVNNFVKRYINSQEKKFLPFLNTKK